MTCPICNKKTQKVIANELRDGSKSRVYFCERCEFGILGLKTHGKDLKDFYATEYRQIGKPKQDESSDAEELFNIYQEFQGDRIKLLKKYFGKNKRLLELGCSSGMFLYHAKKYMGEVVGNDYDIASADFARKKCKSKVYSEDMSNTPEKKYSFDVTVAFQTLEHVESPSEFIAVMKEYTKPNGVIAVEVPNLYDVLPHIYNLPNHYKFFFHSSHPWYFTEKSLILLMEQAGIKGKIYHVQDYNVLNHVHWIQNDTTQSDCLPGLRAPNIPIRSSASTKIKTEIDAFFKTMDLKYKNLLSKNKITSNILFIGTKTK